MAGNEFQLVKIQTHFLKVQIHCEGCARKVKKLLKRIEGVYLVTIDAEEHKVKVSGIVDSATLIRKLTKSGKRAELCTPSNRQYQKLRGLTNWHLDDKYQDSLQYQQIGVNASNSQALLASELDRGIHDCSSGRNVNESSEKSLMGHTNNIFRTATIGDNPHFAWDRDMVPDALGGKLRSSIHFPDSSKYSGALAGYEDRGDPGLQNLQAPPAYEHYYSPLMMRNDMQHQYQYNLPSPMMPNNYIPDMHTIYHSRMNDNSFLHQPQGFVNPMLPPVTHHYWNYY